MLEIIERRVRERRKATEPVAQLLSGGWTMAPMAGPGCDMCRECAAACPTSAIEITEKWSIDAGRCLWCGECIRACPRSSLSYSKECPAVMDKGQLVLKDEGGIEELGRRLDESAKKVLGRSLAIREVDAGSCNGCEVEVNSLFNPVYDLERFGIKVVASPRHADLLLVTGPVTRNMEEALRKTYMATPEPRLVAAMGTCAISGGPFGGGYSTGKGVDSVIPVDIYIPGCPPHPRTVLMALLKALERLRLT